MNKIAVMGFPHSGTTILRKIIGNSPDVYDFEEEIIDMPKIEVEEDSAVIKFTCIKVDTKRHEKYKCIAIIKNPLDVFGSIYKRFGHLSARNHTVGHWNEYAKSFISCTADNIFKVKYEDLFGIRYKKIKEIYKFLGLDFSRRFVKMKRIISVSPIIVDIPKDMPKNCKEGINHGIYRSWQVNQPFKNKTGKSRKFLDEESTRIITSLDSFKTLGYK